MSNALKVPAAGCVTTVFVSGKNFAPPTGTSDAGVPPPEAVDDAPGVASEVAAPDEVPAAELLEDAPAAGTFKAFDTTCPHQGCAVSSVADNQIVCPCHQSHFDLSTGEPTPESQAKRPLTAKQVTVTGDTFTVA